MTKEVQVVLSKGGREAETSVLSMNIARLNFEGLALNSSRLSSTISPGWIEQAMGGR
jgi:hypothetical protein